MQHIDNNDENYCKYKYSAKNEMNFAKCFWICPLPLSIYFCTAIWCQSAHRSNSSGNPTHSKDDLQLQQQRATAAAKAKSAFQSPAAMAPSPPSVRPSICS